MPFCRSGAQPASVTTQTGPVAVERFAGGRVHPWGMVFLPDGRLLVTERPGRLRIVSPDGTLSEPLTGVPQVFAQGQGGLLDVALDPTSARTAWFTSPSPNRARAAPRPRSGAASGRQSD